MSQPTISLHDARSEYLVKFCGARRNWDDALKSGNKVQSDYWNGEMKKYAALLDLNTRLQNEMKGRTRK